MKLHTLFFFVLLLATKVLSAQKLPEKGVPLMQSFTPEQYHHKGKIWAFATAPNGIVYMAADKGLLEYDGKTWKNYKGSDGFTRSIAVENDSLLYTGSDLDFGVWKKNKYGNFEYQTLYSFKEDLAPINEEFWQVHRVGDGQVLFVSAYNIYQYKNQQLTKISAPKKFSGSFWVNDTLYFADPQSGLYVWSNLRLQHMVDFPPDVDFQLSGMYANGNELFLVSKSAGIFRYTSGKLSRVNNALSEYLKTAKVFSFTPINQQYIAFGTVLKGLFIADTSGKIIHQINKYKGLPNNTILSLHHSPNGKLWVGMDYGISALHLSSNTTYFYDYRGDFGTGYTTLLKDEMLYIGTNQGLYQIPWVELNDDKEFFNFRLIPGSEGQVWTLQNINNSFLIGHDKGLFKLINNTLENLSARHGVWTMQPYRDFLLVGTYNGIDIFQKSGNSWAYWKQMEFLYGSCNQLLLEKENVLWVNIPTFGIIRAELDPDAQPTKRQIFLKNTFEGDDLYLEKKQVGIVVKTTTSEYAYLDQEKTFAHKEPTTPINKMEEKLPAIFHSVLLNPDFDFLPIYNGFALHFSGQQENDAEATTITVFRNMRIIGAGSSMPLHLGSVIPYQFNSLKLEFILPNENNVQYQHQLDANNDWSEWTDESAIELTNLPFGKHTVLVRAMTGGKITPPASVSFWISAPWYRTWYAYFVYALCLAAAVYVANLWKKTALKQQEKQWLLKQEQSLKEQAQKHQQALLLLEQQRLQAENEEVKMQLKNKTIELANKAKENEDKNRLLNTLKEKCTIAQQNSSVSKKVLTEMQRLLETYPTVEDKTFEIQIDELHQEFFRKLKEIYPGLSSNDLRLCAYLKIGLNSKEIADILNILPSSVYISRSRLRKKLNIGTDDDLYNYLNTI